MEKITSWTKNYGAQAATFGVGIVTAGAAGGSIHQNGKHLRHAKVCREYEIKRQIQRDVRSGKLSLLDAKKNCIELGLDTYKVLEPFQQKLQEDKTTQTELNPNLNLGETKIPTERKDIKKGLSNDSWLDEEINGWLNEEVNGRYICETFDFSPQIDREFDYTVAVDPCPPISNSSSIDTGFVLACGSGAFVFSMVYIGFIYSTKKFSFLKNIFKSETTELLDQQTKMHKKFDKMYLVQEEILNKLNNK